MKRVPRPLQDYPNLAAWADAVSTFLRDEEKQPRTEPHPILLARRYNNGIDAKATEDGILLFNEETGLPEFSYNGNWYSLATVASTGTDRGAAAVGGTGTLNVSFSLPYTAAPAVTVTPLSHVDPDVALVASIRNLTKDGFTVDLKAIESTFDTIVKPSTGTVHWIAFGAL